MISMRNSSWHINAPLVIAHRGASLQAPENTLSAFCLAADLGADAIEMDAKLSADKCVVIHHDLTLERTTNGRGRVSTQRLDELKQLDAGIKFDISFSEERIPTLEEVIELVGDRLLFNIELTNYASPFDNLPEVVVDIIRKYGIQSKVLISSFNPIALIRTRMIEPDMTCGLLIKSSEPRWIRGLFQRLGRYEAIHPSYDLIDNEFMQQSIDSGKLVNAWTVNDREKIVELLELGVGGIITDDPGSVRDLILKR
jgi:glycerophosphoryl diester phosphodiesterase